MRQWVVGLVLGWSAVACGGSVDGSTSPADGEATPARATPADGAGSAVDNASSAADGSGEDSANGVAPPARICNGSDETRLALVQYGGFRSILGGFSELNGSSYFAIDGHCQFWVGDETLRGLRTGTLDGERAQAIAAELHYGELGGASSYRGNLDSCIDCGVSALRAESTILYNDGGSPADATVPPLWTEAFVASWALWSQLDGQGTPAWGQRPTQLLALRELDTQYLAGASEWTATLDLEAHAVQGFEEVIRSGFPTDAAVLVEDEPTLQVLDTLRRGALTADPYAQSFSVRDAQGRVYTLLLRDDPPEPIVSDLRALLPR